MRSRILLVGAVVAAALAVTPATLASGGRNPQTAGLQVALRAEGLYRGPIDAISGPETVAAVRAFQQMQGLRVTGLADARTRAAMGPLGGPLFGARTLHHGAFGWDVAVLQFLLVRQGISVPVNAYYDRPTLHGVRLMQQRLHLRSDGVVGPHTFFALPGQMLITGLSNAVDRGGRTAVVEYNNSGEFVRTIIKTENPERYGIRIADYFV